MTDYMALGRKAFEDGMTEDQIKTQHPQFRSGWREAKRVHEARTAPISTLRPEKVERPDPDYKYELKWAELTTICKYHPWNVLERKRPLRVLAVAARRVIWDRRDEITSFGQAVQMMRVMWEGILQQGYDEGILDKKDLAQYDFEPKEQESK